MVMVAILLFALHMQDGGKFRGISRRCISISVLRALPRTDQDGSWAQRYDADTIMDLDKVDSLMKTSGICRGCNVMIGTLPLEWRT
jgi:thiamine biosynthesis protein ThiC